MKKILLFCFVCLTALGLLINHASGQKNGGNKVTIKITSDGKIISDTTFQLKEGQDPEAVKKVISHVLEGNIQVISGDEGHQKIVWVNSKNDKEMRETEDIDIRSDSTVKHSEMVMVHKGKHPHEVNKEMIIKEGPGDKESEGEVIIESGNEVEISEGEDGSKIIIITGKGDKEIEPHQKKIKVYIEGNGDTEILDYKDLELSGDKNADTVEVFIIKEDDGTKVVKHVKKVEVTVKEENESGNKSIEPSVEPAPKPDKKKK